MRRVYLMRHGETLYQGRASADGTDLTPTGRRQAERAAAALGTARLDLVLASPLRRAGSTARIVAERDGLAVETAAELREIVARPPEGIELTELFSRMIGFFASPGVSADTPFVGGETFRELRSRVEGFVTGLVARPGWVTALVVAHGGTNAAFLAAALGLPEDHVPLVEQDLGCVNVIDYEASGRAIVRLLNYTVHDPLKAERGSSAVHLRRILAERREEITGVRWRAQDQDPEV